MPIDMNQMTNPEDEQEEIKLLTETLDFVFQSTDQFLEILQSAKQVVDYLIPALTELKETSQSASLRSRLTLALKNVSTSHLRNDDEETCEIGDIVVLNEPVTSPDYQVPWLVRDVYLSKGQPGEDDILYVHLLLYDMDSRTLIMDEVVVNQPKREIRCPDSRCQIVEKRGTM